MVFSRMGAFVRRIFLRHPTFIGVALIPSDGDEPIRYLILAASAKLMEPAREELRDRFYDYFNERGFLDSTSPNVLPGFSYRRFGSQLHVTSLLRGEQRVVIREKLEEFLENECFEAPVVYCQHAGKGVDVIIVKTRLGKRHVRLTGSWRNITPLK